MCTRQVEEPVVLVGQLAGLDGNAAVEPAPRSRGSKSLGKKVPFKATSSSVTQRCSRGLHRKSHVVMRGPSSDQVPNDHEFCQMLDAAFFHRLCVHPDGTSEGRPERPPVLEANDA